MIAGGFATADANGIWIALLFFVATTRLTSASDAKDDSDNNDYVTAHRTPTSADYFGESVRKHLADKCLSDYSMTCWKLDLVGLIDSLRAKGSFQVVPGLKVVREAALPSLAEAGVPPELANDVLKGGQNSSYKLDALIIDKVERFIRSVKFKVHLEDSEVLKNLRNTATQIIDNLTSNTNPRSAPSQAQINIESLIEGKVSNPLPMLYF